ncbi:hypothetical protein [Endozoicomonas sp. SCSIO W0465]|nr:hypothetical protein [Endozoicomonas sp. SCSIO W0465]USE38977.1 hypothetical protein MJO57_12910 [Endozoicomonas sp. SCSIO W0465]
MESTTLDSCIEYDKPVALGRRLFTVSDTGLCTVLDVLDIDVLEAGC